MASLFSLKRFFEASRIILIFRIPLFIFFFGVILTSNTWPGPLRPFETTAAISDGRGALAVGEADLGEDEVDEIPPSRRLKHHSRSRQPSLRRIIADAGCFGKDEIITQDYEREFEVAIAASWQGISKDQLAAEAGLSGDARYLKAGMVKMLAKAGLGIRQFKRDLHAYGKDVCPLLRFEQSGLFEHSDKHYFRAAQTALFVAGCAADLDKYSRTKALRSWSAIAKTTPSVRSKSVAGFPQPSDVIALIRNLRSVACDPKSGGFNLDIRPFVWLASTLEFHCDSMQAESLESVVRMLAQPSASRALVQRAMLLVWKSIETSELFERTGRLTRGCELPAKFVGSLLNLSQAKHLKGPLGFEYIYSHAEVAADVYFGKRFLFGVGVQTNLDLGTRLLARAGAIDTLKTALAAGIINHLPDDIRTPEASSQPELYQDYATFLKGRISGHSVARSYIRALTDPRYDPLGQISAGGIDLPYHELIPVIRLAHLAADFPAVADTIAQQGDAWLNYTISIILIEGQSVAGRNIDRGIFFLKIAARKGLPEASFRLAVAEEYGLGGVQDKAKAIRLYEEAANGEDPAALYALARIYEDGAGVSRDLTIAATWYGRTAQGRYFDATALVHRVLEGGAFIRSSTGKAFLEGLTSSHNGFAKQLGDAFLCVECGGVVDVKEAAFWYRLAVSLEEDSAAAYPLIRILMTRPDLAENPDELVRMLDWLSGENLVPNDVSSLSVEVFKLVGQIQAEPPEEAKQSVKERLDSICIKRNTAEDEGLDGWKNDPDQCSLLLHTLALGGFGSQYVAPGFELLHDLANQTDRWKPKAAFADVLAFYGDFRGGSLWFSQAAKSQPDEDGKSNAYTASRAILTRAVLNQITKKGTPSDDLLDVLRALARLGDQSASSLLTIAQGSARLDFSQLGIANGSIEDQLPLYRAQVDRGVGRGLAERARSLGAAYFIVGDHKQALRYELIGLQTERQLLAAESINNGPISAALADVCTLSKSSQRVAQYGYRDAAMVLAKLAVNRLQGVRRDVAGLPEHLQLCFRDAVGGYYRSLADLFVQQNRPAEAEFVMSLLDDFERFKFLSQDEHYVGDSFSEMPFIGDEERIRNAIDAFSAPPPFEARQYATLKAKQKQQTLSTAEDNQLKELSAALLREDERLQQVVEEISNFTHAKEDNIRREFSGMQSWISKQYRGKAVAIRYIILPDKIDAILITGDKIKPFTWNSIDGRKFSETAFNEKIMSFRNALQDTRVDPRPLGNDLYDVIFKPLSKEIRDIGATRIFVSSDGRLRGVPLGALHDGTHYLVEDFVISAVSGVRRAGDGGARDLSRVAFLGVSDAIGGFPRLDSVLAERDSIVRHGTEGVLPGVAIMNGSFTVEAFKNALRFKDGDQNQLGIVHIATHFKIGTNESDSFLQLGQGRLTVEQLKAGTNQFRFSDVGLLTLSACDTATSIEDGDGSELKSLASVTKQEGAGAVLASLWSIRDPSTAAFMGRFYQIETSDGFDHAASLTQVMREFIHPAAGLRGLSISGSNGIIFSGYSHPIYWAPFVLLEGR